jgi:ABC-type polysaccharide/polyol phosphate transport system ATPase subunit
MIKVTNVSKSFHQRKGRRLLREHVKDVAVRRAAREFQALRGVSFEVAKGESVALIGMNGAGKSTLLAMVCGLVHPDEGAVEVGGPIAALLELGSGFHPDLTGRENVFLNAAYLGMKRAEAAARFDEIVSFAELEQFIDQPIRTYSAGMVMRLGFSVAVHCAPSILIVDEVLGVGDMAFQQKCLERVKAMRAAGTTMLCVSHVLGQVLDLCDRAVWLHHGEVMEDGPVDEVVAAYRHYSENPVGHPKSER